MKRVLVTGGAGFIGSHVVDFYIKHGYEVGILDNFSSGKKVNVHSKATVFTCDLLNTNQIKVALSEFSPSIINHHASQVSVGISIKNASKDARINILGTINLMKSLSSIPNLEQVIYASSGGAVYGNLPRLPYSEDMIPMPESPYGISKLASEHYVRYFSQKYNIPWKILRYSNAYGPRQSTHGETGVITLFMKRIGLGLQPVIYGDGTTTRDYIYVKDIAQANILATKYVKSGIWNISSNKETTITSLYRNISKIMKYPEAALFAPSRFQEVKRSRLSNIKAKNELHWEPRHTLSQGLIQTHKQAINLPER